MLRDFMEDKLTLYLMELKITPNLKGYSYIKEATIRVCENNEKKYNMSTNLYKELAEFFNEKVSLLDRSLRHAIDVSCRRNGVKDFERILKVNFSDKKPSVKEIICILAEKLKIDIRQANLSI